MLKGAGALGLAAGLGTHWRSGRAFAQDARFGKLSKEWDGTTINVSLVAEPRSDQIQALTPEFTEATGITVNYNILPYPNLEEQQLTALSQQTGEQDLIHVDCVWMGQYAGQGWLHPVDEFVAQTDPAVLDLEDFMPRILAEQSTWEDTLYGLPFITAVFGLYYRTDIFEELSLEPPTTWDELALVAQTIHEAKSGEGVAGLTMMGKRGVQLLCTHLNVFGSMGGYYFDDTYQPTMASEAGVNSIDASFRVLFSGACARFPKIPFVVVEGNIGWIPTAMEQVDDMFLRYRWFTGATEIMKEMPSRLFHRSFWGTFMIDTIGIELRHHLNIDHIMWSTDYPHTGSDWPNNRVTIQRLFRGVPKDEVRKMLHTNCKTLYRLDHIPDRLPA